jgi:2-methylcitrate dehydratase PrpD
MTPTEKIARFVCDYSENDMPQEAVERTKAAIMDYVGVTLSGVSERSSKIVRQVITTLGGNPQATIWGEGIKTSVQLAALANGTAAHALDLDDTNMVMMSHPSIQLLPGLFALGEYEHRSGSEILLAYITGFEVGAKLGRALNPNLVHQGWFPVGTLGTLMQTAACAKLLGLEPNQVQMALGISTNLASGLRCNNGTMTKPLTAGHVGSNGIIAALLAREGMNADSKALETQFGFFENFCRGDQSVLEEKINSLGEPLDILQTGLSYKLYPCCAGTHMPIDCALDIVGKHPLNPEDIQEIDVSVDSRTKFLLIHPRPKTDAEAKFSLEYCVSRAILDGKMQSEQFGAEKIEASEVKTLIEKVKPQFKDDPMIKEGERGLLPVQLQIKMKDGSLLSSQVDCAKGTPGNPLSTGELEEKFQQCCKGILPDGQVIRLINQLRNFDQLQDIAEFIFMLG